MGRGGENISTHAPLAGRDRLNLNVSTRSLEFQPTRPLRGATLATGRVVDIAVFQPTRPLRGATITGQLHRAHRGDFNPRAPCGARPPTPRRPCSRPYFNPRAPCGARRLSQARPILHQDFNPRAPCGARLTRTAGVLPSGLYFNPRAPCGARLCYTFLLTFACISTHAPLAGRDSKSVQITMHIFAITDKFQMLLHRMPPVRAFCSFLMQENHADFGCEPPR